MLRAFTSRTAKQFLAAVLFLAALFALCAAALAEQPTPVPTPVSYTDYNNNTPDNDKKIYLGLYNTTQPQSQPANDLYSLKKLLYENGYFEAVGVASAEIGWQNNMLDDSTLNALREYCLRNRLSEYDNQLGLTYGAWWRISSGEIINLNAPEETGTVYREIRWGEGGEGLTAILDRLYELGYLENRAHEVYDGDVRDALEQFGQNNGLQDYYSQDGEDSVRSISEDLQRVLFSEDASRKPEPKKGGLPEYFMKKVEIAGLKLPMLALWCIGLAVLVACVLAAIYFFMPSDSRKKDKHRKNVVRFDIAYEGKTQRTEAEITKSLKIGRGVGNFPLDLSDTEISRRHCELYYLNGVLMLRDYSTFGTYINDKFVHNKEDILKSGDVLVIGKHKITVTF